MLKACVSRRDSSDILKFQNIATCLNGLNWCQPNTSNRMGEEALIHSVSVYTREVCFSDLPFIIDSLRIQSAFFLLVFTRGCYRSYSLIWCFLSQVWEEVYNQAVFPPACHC